ncbi:50S ribosomal protein L10 [Oxobacter pfennigii]|uniref:Large ribosomal subunit protein uL10 n=1 Tax=Oxobacter pfennigii TaxID=36849 RepID=A0A0P8YSI8_9CLOT|nr:50S ribosomal protein L10 [Oxobacter pfennigii]KPU42643.1 50S ribosomal protein L10 [Oxobacter pfennigii]
MGIKQEKEAMVQEIKDKLTKAQTVIMADYRGLTVEEDTELRRKFREAGVEYKVLKNTLTSIAAKEAGIEGLDAYLAGPTSFAFGYDDATAPARILNDFAKDHKKLELKGGLVQGKLFNVDNVKELATIPPREVLIAKLLGSFKAPMSNFAYLVNAIKEKKEQEA